MISIQSFQISTLPVHFYVQIYCVKYPYGKKMESNMIKAVKQKIMQKM